MSYSQSVRAFAALATISAAAAALAAIPNRPVITEVFMDPAGNNDGPVGRLAANPHQEYIEIYLPPAANLNPAYNKDALRLTFYEVEGDTTSSGYGLVNYRFDLPTFDLDSSNGITPGAIARPSTGLVVLGWVDYVGNPPTNLAGTPSTRVALINGGVTGTSGFTFVPINGHHFGGTTNFPILTAESLVDLPGETGSGVIQNGSGVYLLVNRDSPGYVQLYDDEHVPGGGSADPNLPAGTVLGTGCLMDGFAGNDDGDFDPTQQPYSPGTIDLSDVLPLGGAFSRLACQVPEIQNGIQPGNANGYARRFIDVAKTTENGFSGDDNPVTDALNAYRTVRNEGPFYPSPGKSALTTSPGELTVAAATEQAFAVLAGTTGRPGMLCANVGGSFNINLSASGGASSNPNIATFSPGSPAAGISGQSIGLPTVAITAQPAAPHNGSASASITVTATRGVGTDPPIVNPVQAVTVTATVLKPTAGRNASGQPFQTTVFAAVQAIVSNPSLANELRPTSFGNFLAANLGGRARDWHGHAAALIDAATDLSDPSIAEDWVEGFPGDESLYIDAAGPPGRPSLVQTVLSSAEVQSGAGTYDQSFNSANTALRAIRVNIPDTLTSGGTFTPSETIHFADEKGTLGALRSGLTNATTTRTFECAIVDTNVRLDGSIETGATDDFGIIVQARDVEPGSPVLAGEFVFLSFTGGLQGADLDGLQVPPGANVLANIVYLDLDNLDAVLGVRSIEQIFFIDAGDDAEADLIEALSLNPVAFAPCEPCDTNCDGSVNGFDIQAFVDVLSGGGTACSTCAADANGDGSINAFDIQGFVECLGG